MGVGLRGLRLLCGFRGAQTQASNPRAAGSFAIRLFPAEDFKTLRGVLVSGAVMVKLVKHAKRLCNECRASLPKFPSGEPVGKEEQPRGKTRHILGLNRRDASDTDSGRAASEVGERNLDHELGVRRASSQGHNRGMRSQHQPPLRVIQHRTSRKLSFSVNDTLMRLSVRTGLSEGCTEATDPFPGSIPPASDVFAMLCAVPTSRMLEPGAWQAIPRTDLVWVMSGAHEAAAQNDHPNTEP
eukprot:2253204-Rhodomonas_salina.2